MKIVYNDGRMFQIAFQKNEIIDGMTFEEYLCHGIREIMNNNHRYLEDTLGVDSWRFESDHTCCMFLLKMMSRDFNVPVSALYGKKIQPWIIRRYGFMAYFSELAVRMVREKYGFSLYNGTYGDTGDFHADMENPPKEFSILRYNMVQDVTRRKLITELIKNNMQEDEQLVLTFNRFGDF